MEFPVQLVRDQFPALKTQAIFFDNPAGTQVPHQVVDAVSASLIRAASGPGGYFQASREASSIYDRAHGAMAELLGGTSGREILIGQSMTMLTFQISRSLGLRWKPGDEIIVTRMDHEGNIAPWVRLAEEHGFTIRWLPFSRETWRIEPGDLKALLNEKTRLVALNYASNLTGSINPIAQLSSIAKSAGALVYVDAVQFVPHGFVDVKTLGCDFFVCSSYKFFGPHLGVLWGREALLADLLPYTARCATKELPGRHGTGTPQAELLAGLAAAVDYLVWLGEQTGATGDRRSKLAGAYRAATSYEMSLARQLIEGLSAIAGFVVHGITDTADFDHRVPTISVTRKNHSNTSLARALGERSINVWSGHNYALELARHLGLDESEGVLRLGLAHYNTSAEVSRVLESLRAVTA